MNLRQGTFFPIFFEKWRKFSTKEISAWAANKKNPQKTLTGSGGGEDPGREREREGINQSKEALASPVLLSTLPLPALSIREGVFAHAFLEVSPAVAVSLFCDTTRTAFWF